MERIVSYKAIGKLIWWLLFGIIELVWYNFGVQYKIGDHNMENIKIKGLKKAVGKYKELNAGYHSPRYGHLMFDKESGELSDKPVKPLVLTMGI